jgi:hypothetical protein
VAILLSIRRRLVRLERQVPHGNHTEPASILLTDEERVAVLLGFLERYDCPNPFPLLEGACWLEAFAPLYEASKVQQMEAESMDTVYLP